MFYLVFAAVLIISFIIGSTAWAQIIGSLRNRSDQKAWFVPVIIWLAVLIALFFVVYKFLAACLWAYLIAMLFSLLFNFRKRK